MGLVAQSLDHVDLNASDYRESVRFYETVLAPLGIPKIDEHVGGTCFTNLDIVDRRPPTRNLHLCFYARRRVQVDAFHEAGIEAGFRSNGAPAYRSYGPGYYAAYLLDPMATTSKRYTEMSGTWGTMHATTCADVGSVQASLANTCAANRYDARLTKRPRHHLGEAA